ncbi:uncharacterized protein F5891DRAFT_980774 [Suillus fuscotomentosus]|uniref:Uncharacterized protein n=1 Tax=Suillus fuscotomentosus TaxID=1912939 RepID=A0AAD4E7M2_9AGAM|nr:uncharacterized protein F5891DRAFT_980774 [Suillus fuscotomentosus]KAG1899823.1 hypothetical protein F5891DRAFT_980774 [Suillus fuscotomentosus]
MASQTHSSIFDPLNATDDVSDHNNNGTSLNVKVQESMTLTWHVEREGQPAPSTADSGITTKRKGPGRPKKKKSDETGAPAQDLPPTAPQVTYYLSIFSEVELRKAKKQRKSINSFLQQAADLPFDTLKAQLLAQISAKLNPNKISYDNYDITWTVPQIQPSPLALVSDGDYTFLLQHALKHKEPQASITIKARSNKKSDKKRRSKGNHHDADADTSSEEDVPDSDESDNDRRPKKKVKKMSGKDKLKALETSLNTKINTKIQQLRDRWMCSKPGCTSEFCFIHPEYPEHFQLGHKHLSVWAAAWNKDEAQADLKTPPNYTKFNALPGQKGAPSLLQCRLAECAQPGNQSALAVINHFVLPWTSYLGPYLL